MSRRALLAALLLACGCSATPDVCAGVDGACIALALRGPAGQTITFDRVHVFATQGFTLDGTSPSNGPAHLPAILAVEPPLSFPGGTFTLAAEIIAGGTLRAAGSVTDTLAANQHKLVTIEVGPGPGSDGGLSDGGGGDLPPVMSCGDHFDRCCGPPTACFTGICNPCAIGQICADLPGQCCGDLNTACCKINGVPSCAGNLVCSPNFMCIPGTSADGGTDGGVTTGSFTTMGIPPAAGVSAVFALAAADFDHNGTPDLLAGVSGGLWLAGTNTKITVPLTQVRSIAVADFNRDGRPDVVVCDQASEATYFLPNVAGGFGTPVAAIGPAFGVADVAAGDFNNDGNVDVVGGTSSGLVVALGDGKGGFSVQQYATSNGPIAAVAVGDFNRDGNLDVAANAMSKLGAYWGDGKGSFTTFQPAPAAALAYPGNLAVADFNRDGALDLAAANSTGAVTIYLSAAGNTLFMPSGGALAGVANVLAVAAGDFNGDGIPDVAATQSGNPAAQGTTVLVGFVDSTGKIASNVSVSSAGNTPEALVAVDYDRDGRLDLAIGNNSGMAIGVAINQISRPTTFALTLQTAGFMVPAVGATSNWTGPLGLAAADLNRDGILDLVATAIPPAANAKAGLGIGMGDGKFTASTAPAATGAAGLAVADANHDGILDVLIAVSTATGGPAGMTLDTGAAAGPLMPPSYTATMFPASANPSMVAMGDLNRDGWPDAVVGSAGGTSVAVLLNTPGMPSPFPPTPSSSATVTGNSPAVIALGDFNEDGVLDLVTANRSPPGAGASILLGTNPGVFQTASAISALPDTPTVVGVADFNRDGHLDVLAFAASTGPKAEILLGNGAGGFTLSTESSPVVTAIARSLVLADLNGDGFTDALVPTSSGLFVLLYKPGGFSFATPAVPLGPMNQGGATVGDFNRDGKLDIAVVDDAGAVSIYLNTST